MDAPHCAWADFHRPYPGKEENDNKYCTCSGSDTQSVEQEVHVIEKIKEHLY